MNTTEKTLSTSLAPLTYAWLGLLVLTITSLYLGQWFHGTPWLQLLVAAIIWVKGMLVARRFIEVEVTHPFIRRVVYVFVSVTPLALAMTAYFGTQLAHWASR
ncbi:hypothetical protein ABWL39_03005 [Chitinivorax sp. PXF-14]|uniref:hypothetical protein n=1 Tax=Chitinivorax sp. PXF-14 TaxID=3230488 RepID=UPI0034674DC6